ncbi:serine endopeptidase [Massilia sp. PWRC2]|uniref:serine endopeptidase n=1 Tax=Massilia sp. PWRC2 TaxID=2804626 RepID=UPI003CF69961
MAKGLRLTQTWMERGLWLVALVFAAFLIGLGGKIVENLWQVQAPPPVESYIARAPGDAAQAAIGQARDQQKRAEAALEQAQQAHKVAVANTASAQQSFQNWLATRSVTARADQDSDLVARTRGLDAFKAAERKALAAIEAQEQVVLDARQARERADQQWNELVRVAENRHELVEQAHETRVFLYRLAVTLPLLLLAGWLFARQRKNAYWPFVWGFIIFALFAFFVELVPYLPSYGGYVRYIVGILVTAAVGRYAITSLQAYLERQKLAEAQPEYQRRDTMSYDMALGRLAKGICPGCERSVDLKDGKTDFCIHCGIGLYNHCLKCSARKNAFAKFCFSCGTPAASRETLRNPGEPSGATARN